MTGYRIRARSRVDTVHNASDNREQEMPDVSTQAPDTQTAPQELPRDERGRFTSPNASEWDGDLPEADEVIGGEEPQPQPKPEEATEETEDVPEPDPEEGEEPDEEEKGEEPELPVGQGLTLDDDKPPVFDHEGKFVGGKFLDKYESLDDALIAFKHAQRMIGKKDTEIQQLRAGIDPGASTVDLGHVYDPHTMTEDKLTALAMKKAGVSSEEMTLDERIEYDHNPAAFLVKRQAKIDKAKREIIAFTDGWAAATRKAFVDSGMDPKLYDRVREEGDRVWKDYASGKLGPEELRVLIGRGVLMREGSRSPEGATRRKPVGRSPEATASTSARTERRTPEQIAQDEADEELRKDQAAAYG